MADFSIPLEERSIAHFLRKHAKESPEKPFLNIVGNVLTFAEAAERSRAIARGYARRGIGPGMRVMVFGPNCLEWVLGWFAASVVGAVTVPVNPALKGPLLEYMLKDATPDALVIDASLLDALLTIDIALMPARVFVTGDARAAPTTWPAGSETFDSLYVREGPDPEAPPDFRRLHSISYTSGTTGPSKGVMSSNAATFCSPVNYIKITAMEPQDSIYAPLPLFHGQASRHGVLSALVQGSTITLDAKFSASRYWERAAECGATLGMIVTAFTSVLLAQPPKASDRGHRMRTMFNCKYKPEFEERFGVRTVEAFAMTEVGHLLHTPYPERRPGSAGRVNEQWEVMVADVDDRPVRGGEPGELLCRPKLPYIMMSGYLNKPEVTLEAFRNLWFHTGDMVREDEEGYFYFLDRKKDRIRRRGENVSSVEVELMIVAHPAVAECAVVPHPAEMGEDEIRAVVILEPGSWLSAEELHKWMRSTLPKFMLPRYVEIVTSIPRNGTGKFEKFKVVQNGLGPTAWDASRADAVKPEMPSARLPGDG